MKKIHLTLWSIIEYPENSGLFELQGKYIGTYIETQTEIEYSTVTSIPYDFHSFDIQSKIGRSYSDGCQFRNRVTSFESVEYHLDNFVPTKHVDNEALALEIIEEWTKKPNDSTRFRRGPVLSPCFCDDEE